MEQGACIVQQASQWLGQEEKELRSHHSSTKLQGEQVQPPQVAEGKHLPKSRGHQPGSKEQQHQQQEEVLYQAHQHETSTEEPQQELKHVLGLAEQQHNHGRKRDSESQQQQQQQKKQREMDHNVVHKPRSEQQQQQGMHEQQLHQRDQQLHPLPAALLQNALAPQAPVHTAVPPPRTYVGWRVELTGPLTYYGAVIPCKEVQLMTTLAAGGFGQIYRGAIVPDTSPAAVVAAAAVAAIERPIFVAVKLYYERCPMMPGLSAERLAAFAQNEVTALTLLQGDENIVQLMGEGVLVVKREGGHGSSSSSTIRLRCIILEFAESSIAGELERGGPFPLDEIKEVTYDVLKGLERMHERVEGVTITHRDIKAANLLRGFKKGGGEDKVYEKKVKIADFGACHLLDKQEGGGHGVSRAACTDIGSRLHRAPETYTLRRRAAGEEEPTYGRTVDCFSVGVLVLEMLAGGVDQLPAPPDGSDPDGMKWQAVLQKIYEGKEEVKGLDQLSAYDKDMLLQLLQSTIGVPGLRRRWEVWLLLKHPWFNPEDVV